MTQPGVFRCWDTPFAHIIGLYSNVAENPGFISEYSGQASEGLAR